MKDFIEKIIDFIFIIFYAIYMAITIVIYGIPLALAATFLKNNKQLLKKVWDSYVTAMMAPGSVAGLWTYQLIQTIKENSVFD